MENKKTKIVSMIAIIALVLTVITATYAYFQAQTGEGSQTDVKITANTVDTLTFETGDPITLTLDQENFAQGAGNQTGSTFAKAMLTANNKTNTATEHYYMYLNIIGNTFTYTQDEETPEILLTITDTNNNEITNINGLTHTTVTDASGASISGFDITNKSGLITLFDNREITTTSSITEEWNVTVTYVNYNVDQSANAGKSFNAKLVIQKNKLTLLKDYVIAQYTGTQGENNIYYHDSTLANGAGDNSYRYSGGDSHPDYYSCKYDGNDVQNATNKVNIALKGDCSKVYKATIYVNNNEIIYIDKSLEQYLEGSIAIQWDSTNSKCVTVDDEEVYDFYGNDVTDETKCTGTAYHNTMRDEYQIGIEEVGAGEETLVTPAVIGVNNFVCFGSTASICPTDNLYRIIGVINDKVKLIKYDYTTNDLLGADGDYLYARIPDANYYKGTLTSVNTYYWNYKATNKATNTWSTSLLNKTNLNTNFINNIEAAWAKKIAITTWKVGGNAWSNIGIIVPSVAYQNEIVSPVTTNSTDNATEYEAKIGLMYVSDYGFAASPESWTTAMNSYSTVRNNNWMHMGQYEWTISRVSDYSSSAFYVSSNGSVYNDTVSDSRGVRPAFNLESFITYKSGTGTMSDPILIN